MTNILMETFFSSSASMIGITGRLEFMIVWVDLLENLSFGWNELTIHPIEELVGIYLGKGRFHQWMSFEVDQ
jgi:hypothetical protein